MLNDAEITVKLWQRLFAPDEIFNHIKERVIHYSIDYDINKAIDLAIGEDINRRIKIELTIRQFIREIFEDK
jgi:hypothetical protein